MCIRVCVWGGVYYHDIYLEYMWMISVIHLSMLVLFYISNCCANHMFYADDLFVIEPSACALQALLNIYSKYDFENNILYNLIKSICMVVKPHGYQLICPDFY